MKRSMSIVAVALITLTLGGCAAFDSVLSTIGLGGTKNQIEALLAAQAEGTYTVKFEKNGAILLQETWICTKDATSGKLTGCHKQ